MNTNSGTRYFYDCPLKAAYMQRYFGMRLQETYNGHATYVEIPPAVIRSQSSHPSIQPAYVHPHSLHLLEPQPGDFGWDAENSFVACYSDGCFCLSPIGDYAVSPVRIIQRDGKPFFWPEREEV